MKSLNRCEIIGNLGQDPEVNHTKSGTAVANISVATTSSYKDSNDQWQDETTWHRVVLWARKAEIAQEYLSKGDRVYISGRIQKSKYEDKDGNERTSTEINARELIMLGGSDSTPNNNSGAKNANSAVDSNTNLDTTENVDDDLPF